MKKINSIKYEKQAVFAAIVNKDYISSLLNTDIEYFTDDIAIKTYNWIKKYKNLNKEGRIGVPYIITDSNLTKEEADLLVDPGMYNGNYSELLQKIENSWPDPIPFTDYSLKRLPVNIFPQWLKDHIISISEFTQTPVDMSVLLVLSSLSTALSKVALIKVKNGFTEPLNIWTCTILPPANRKSAVFKHIINPILQYEEILGKQVEPERRHAIQEKNILEDQLNSLKQKLKKSKQHKKQINEVYELSDKIAEMNIPSIPRIVADDITPEKISEIMAINNGRIAILSPEGDLFKLMAGRYSKNGSANLDVYKKGWTGNEQVRVDRIGRKSIFVENPTITIGITVQPIMLEDLTQKKSFKGEGILGRFIYTIPESPVGNRKTGTEVPCLNKLAAERYNKGINTLLRLLPLNIGGNKSYKPHM